ncbi:hypothetical protein ACJJI3_02390 [Microbulbifer sp. ZKSA004]|uniref:hypothetical protein n=1 Tax=Microbulbifer sp. ZKSA004 TaxID=3243389 RepID=UPI0040399730
MSISNTSRFDSNTLYRIRVRAWVRNEGDRDRNLIKGVDDYRPDGARCSHTGDDSYRYQH